MQEFVSLQFTISTWVVLLFKNTSKRLPIQIMNISSSSLNWSPPIFCLFLEKKCCQSYLSLFRIPHNLETFLYYYQPWLSICWNRQTFKNCSSQVLKSFNTIFPFRIARCWPYHHHKPLGKFMILFLFSLSLYQSARFFLWLFSGRTSSLVLISLMLSVFTLLRHDSYNISTIRHVIEATNYFNFKL